MTTTDKNTQKWLDEMIMALRLREVRGTAIGDAVAAIETHCAESGESPAEAFGDPREYAASLDFAPRELATAQQTNWLAVLAPIAAGLVGVNLVGPIVTAFDQHSSVAITWGWLAALVVLALGVALAVRIIGALLANWVNLALFFAGFLTLSAGVGIVIKTVAFTMSPWLALGVAVLLVGLSVVGQHLVLPTLDDPLIDPRRPHQGSNRAALGMVKWIFVIVAAAMVLINCIPIWLR